METRRCFDYYFVTSRTPEGSKGTPIVKGWWSDDEDAHKIASGMLAGHCTLAGIKHAKVKIYEGEILRFTISW